MTIWQIRRIVIASYFNFEFPKLSFKLLRKFSS